LIPVADYLKGIRPSLWRYAVFLVPTAAFTALFLLTLSKNVLIGASYYSVGPHALLVLVKSLARLLWPWLFVLFVPLRIEQRRWPPVQWIVACTVLLAVPLRAVHFPYLSGDSSAREGRKNNESIDSGKPTRIDSGH